MEVAVTLAKMQGSAGSSWPAPLRHDMPISPECSLSALIIAVRYDVSRSRTLDSIGRHCCPTVFTPTKRISGSRTAPGNRLGVGNIILHARQNAVIRCAGINRTSPFLTMASGVKRPGRGNT